MDYAQLIPCENCKKLMSLAIIGDKEIHFCQPCSLENENKVFKNALNKIAIELEAGANLDQLKGIVSDALKHKNKTIKIQRY
jgi:deoxycytidylate deaminase